MDSNFLSSPPLQIRRTFTFFDLIAVQARFSADSETPSLHMQNYQIKNRPFSLSLLSEESKSADFHLWVFVQGKLFHVVIKIPILPSVENQIKIFQTPDDPLSLVEDEISGLKYFSPLKDGRFSGGAVGYLSYEYANRVEKTVPVPPKDELGLPLLYFMVTDLLLIFDHAHQSLTICANVCPGDNPVRAYQSACDKILGNQEPSTTTISPISCPF